MCGCEKHNNKSEPCTCICDEHGNFELAAKLARTRYDAIITLLDERHDLIQVRNRVRNIANLDTVYPVNAKTLERAAQRLSVSDRWAADVLLELASVFEILDLNTDDIK